MTMTLDKKQAPAQVSENITEEKKSAEQYSIVQYSTFAYDRMVNEW